MFAADGSLFDRVFAMEHWDFFPRQFLFWVFRHWLTNSVSVHGAQMEIGYVYLYLRDWDDDVLD